MRVTLSAMQIRCPTCGHTEDVEAQFRWRPFCSRRCKMIDLGNWLDEVYRVSRPMRADDFEDEIKIAGR
jgi:uncharacterized protein